MYARRVQPCVTPGKRPEGAQPGGEPTQGQRPEGATRPCLVVLQAMIVSRPLGADFYQARPQAVRPAGACLGLRMVVPCGH